MVFGLSASMYIAFSVAVHSHRSPSPAYGAASCPPGRISQICLTSFTHMAASKTHVAITMLSHKNSRKKCVWEVAEYFFMGEMGVKNGVGASLSTDVGAKVALEPA